MSTHIKCFEKNGNFVYHCTFRLTKHKSDLVGYRLHGSVSIGNCVKSRY